METRVGKLLIYHDYGANKKFAIIIKKIKTRNKWAPAITLLFLDSHNTMTVSKAALEYSFIEI